MKCILISLIALLLALSMIFVGCNEEPPANNDQGNGTPNTPPADTTYTLPENYLPDKIYTQMKAYFESTESGFYPYDDLAYAPLVSTDMLTLSNCVVKSITIPVFSTGKADENGDFTFSIYILSNVWKELRQTLGEPGDPIVIKVNAAEHGLAENTVAVRKFVKVDLTAYDIKLSATQTLGFSQANDTLIPARVRTEGTVDGLGKEKYAPAKYMIDNWGAVGYYHYNPDADTNPDAEALAISDKSLLFDFELERTFESEAAYNAQIADKAQSDAEYAVKLAAVAQAYGGKCFSLMGGSISTFKGLTNSASNHPTLASVPYYYDIDGTVYDYTKTYWGKLSVDTGMELCVINAWSGGRAYGTDKYEGKDNMLTRSYHLGTASGQSPDVIFLNYATNDILYSPSSTHDATHSKYTGNLPTGDLTQRLNATDKTKSDKEIVAEWFAEVEQMAKEAGYVAENVNTVKYGETFITWEASYALALQNIKRLYPDAEVFCFTLAEINHGNSFQPRHSNVNKVIRALAEYFELDIVDQGKCEVNKANCHTYGRGDVYGMHPGIKGHAAITKLIFETLYERLPK